MRYNKGVVNILCLSIFSVQICYFFLSNSAGNIRKSINYNKTIDRDHNKTSMARIDADENNDVHKDEIHRKKFYMTYCRPMQPLSIINCTQIINKDQNEILKLKAISNSTSFVRTNFSSEFYTNFTNNCSHFRDARGYLQHPVTKDEYEFPIAFSILAYTDIEQIERLLRAIYRPHNYYCVHIDLRINIFARIALRKIANCLKNVFIAYESFNITIGDYTFLKAELGCMSTLWPFKRWKYYINLSGQGFPLKTNRQIVAILKVLNGANLVEGSVRRAKKLVANLYNMAEIVPPHNIQLVKGSMHVAVNRYFVNFCLYDKRARDFLEWILTKKDLEETFFSSLNFNPHLGIPGTFLGEPEPYCLKPFLIRYVPLNFPGDRYCQSNMVRQKQCIFGFEDLPTAYNGFDLFAYNFNLDHNPMVLHCLEQVLYASAWKEYVDNVIFDTSYYAHLHYAKMQLKP